MYAILSKQTGNNSDYFTEIEAQAAQLISDITGITVPAAITDAPDWVKYPAALIIAKMAKRLLVEISDELDRQIEADFERALQILKEHPQADQANIPDRANTVIDTLGGLNEW